MSTTDNQVTTTTNLQKQDLSNLDINKLTPLSPEVISRQATINIGTIGHVAHGKSTVVKAISGVQTVRFKNELERNITIKLERIGYKHLLQISKSAKLLQQYEIRESKKLQRLKIERMKAQEENDTIKCAEYHSMPQEIVVHTGRHSQVSLSSSGYSSVNDNVSNNSSDYESQSNTRKRKRVVISSLEEHKHTDHKLLSNIMSIERKQLIKRRRHSVCTSDGRQGNHDRREYIIEYIENMKSSNGIPLFFVKWLNYPTEQNTWEDLKNLFECEALQTFINQRHAFYETTIKQIEASFQKKVDMITTTINASKAVTIHELKKLDPLLIKVDLILLAQFRGKRNVRIISKRLLDAMTMNALYYRRCKQMEELCKWQERMNNIEMTAPVRVENDVDFETLPKDFNYIKESIPDNGIYISENPPIGCKCSLACTRSSGCCPKMAGGRFAYGRDGRLCIEPGGAIYECNSVCSCGVDCVNRVIQRGRKNQLCVFKTSNGCGWGLRTDRLIRKGEYVCEYVGEIINTEEANRRGKEYDAQGRTYLFDLDYNIVSEPIYTIDAAMYGNMSHFINHSCEPNLAVFPFWINNLDVNMPRLAFFALRTIKINEELTFDYIRNDVDINDYRNLSDAQKVTCRCGAEKCRKVLF